LPLDGAETSDFASGLTNNIILTLHFDNRSAIGCPGIEASTATG
jgi:hypothetical protein